MSTHDDEDLQERALTLPPLERAQLARALLRSLRDANDADVARWALAESDALLEATRTFVRTSFGPQIAGACETIAKHVMSDDGLLGRLRPFVGVDAGHLEEVLGAMDTLHGEACAERRVPVAAVEGAVTLQRYVQLWALDEDGMLRRNQLIDDVDLERLREWSWKLGDRLSDLLHELMEQETWRGLTRDRRPGSAL